MNAIKTFLLARFIPHRTAIGLVLLTVTAVAEAITGSALCTGALGPAAVCTVADKVISVAAPWLVIMGVADQKRKD